MFNSSVYNGIVYNGTAGGGAEPNESLDIAEGAGVVNKKATSSSIKKESQIIDIKKVSASPDIETEIINQDINKPRGGIV
jgi:hypothetical protein